VVVEEGFVCYQKGGGEGVGGGGGGGDRLSFASAREDCEMSVGGGG